MRTTNIAKIEGAINIPKDASWNFPPVRSILGPKKVSKISNIQYINVNKLAIQATIGNKLANPSTEKKLNCFTLSMAVKNISLLDRKSTRLNSSHVSISYAVFCLKQKIRSFDLCADGRRSSSIDTR